jgi:hypothetical protein
MASEWQRFVTSPPPVCAQESFSEKEHVRWWNQPGAPGKMLSQHPWVG